MLSSTRFISKKQKTAFIEFMRAHFPNIRIQTDGLSYNRNIVIGNPDTAKVVFGAHYDTQAVMPVPNFIMPRSITVSVLYAFVLIIPMFILAGAVGKAADLTVPALLPRNCLVKPLRLLSLRILLIFRHQHRILIRPHLAMMIRFLKMFLRRMMSLR